MMHQRRPYSDIVKPDAVNSRVYTDPSIFADELEKIFDARWMYVGHESEVPDPGDFKRSAIGLQPVILVRDKQHDVHVFFNRCSHRAATICQAQAGGADNFRCEYHGWTYDLDGTLTHIPYADAYTDVDQTKLGLATPRQVDEYRGFYFACVHGTTTRLADYLGKPVRDQIDLFCDLSPVGRIRVQAGSAKLTYAGNWKLQMENSIDGYHVNFTHQSFIKWSAKTNGQRLTLFDADSPAQCRALGRGHSMLDFRNFHLLPARKQAHVGRLQKTPWGREYYADLVAAHGQDRADEVIAIGGTHMSVFPNLMLLNQQVRNIRPIDATRTEVDLAPALLEAVPDEVNQLRLRQFEGFYTPLGGGIHDDIEMFNRVADGVRGSANAWLMFKRGLGREVVMEDGTISGHVSDEVSQREMWRHWLEVMSTDA